MQAACNDTILVVDDIRLNRQLLKSVLAQYHILEADCGEAALDVVARQIPDLVLLDITMPGIDGFEVCRRLKASAGTADIPVIFITGNDIPGQAGRCFEVGAVDFIAKPFDLNEISARVHTHLSLKRAKESLVAQNRLLEEKLVEQRLNIHLAGRVLSLVNPSPPAWVHLADNDFLHVRVMSQSCRETGGDHYLVKEYTDSSGTGHTLVSVKDQSGHAVNCILRSIVTDLLHNSGLYSGHRDMDLAQSVTLLNNAVCASSLFEDDDFFTALFLDLNHKTRMLRYVSAGHPPFLLVRDGEVRRIPGPGDKGANLPMAVREGVEFAAGSIRLESGDKLLLYTDGLTDMPLSGAGRKTLTGDELAALAAGLACRGRKVVAAFMEELLVEIVKRVETHSLSLEDIDLPDDVTLLGLEIETLFFENRQEYAPVDFGGVDGLVGHLVENIDAAIGGCGGKSDLFRVRMALSEGVTNAWRHGNHSDDSLPITVARHVGNSFWVSVADTGSGFAHRKLFDPRRLENRLDEDGRGIFCMHRYADYVGWLDGGSTLLLAFPLFHHPWDNCKKGAEAAINLWEEPLPGIC